MDGLIPGLLVSGALVGVLLGIGLFGIGMAISDVTRDNTYKDIRDQCERQGSIRLGKEAFFYCSREPVKTK